MQQAAGSSQEYAPPQAAGEQEDVAEIVDRNASILPILGGLARRPLSAASAAALRAAALRNLHSEAPLRAALAAFVALLQAAGGMCLGRAPLLPPCAPPSTPGAALPSPETSYLNSGAFRGKPMAFTLDSG